MRKSIFIILAISLAMLLLSVAGCGGKDKKTEQPAPKPASTQEITKEVPKEEKTGFIVGTEVNAREKASTDSAIVGTFDLGEKVTIISVEPEWAKVKRANGQECYVFKKFLGDQAALDKRKSKYNVKTDVGYPIYLNGDPNYILVDGQMGGAWYLVRNTITEKPLVPGKESPTGIDVDVVEVPDANNGATNITKTRHYTFTFQNENFAGTVSPQAIIMFKYGADRSTTMIKHPAAAMSYYILKGKKWSKFGYDDAFYSRADL